MNTTCEGTVMKIWSCKIGEVDAALLPSGADGPMRDAVADAYRSLTGKDPEFNFSGWGAELTHSERCVVNNVIPEQPKEESDGELLQRLGDDGHAWAVAFAKTAVKLGYSVMDVNWLTGWFANTIEHSNAVRYGELEKSYAAEIDRLRGVLAKRKPLQDWWAAFEKNAIDADWPLNDEQVVLRSGDAASPIEITVANLRAALAEGNGQEGGV